MKFCEYKICLRFWLLIKFDIFKFISLCQYFNLIPLILLLYFYFELKLLISYYSISSLRIFHCDIAYQNQYVLLRKLIRNEGL